MRVTTLLGSKTSSPQLSNKLFNIFVHQNGTSSWFFEKMLAQSKQNFGGLPL